jgi:hypothetical protein
MKIDRRENLIHRYLLGELAEIDQTSFERELLADRDKFDEVWSVEDDLIDSYVRGEMSGAERERFEKHYLGSQLHRERVAIARLFLESIDPPAGEVIEASETNPVASRPSKFPAPRRWLQPAFGAVLVLATFFLIFGAVWMWIERARLTEQIAKIQNEAQTEGYSLKRREQELSSRNRELEKEIADGRQRSEQLRAELEQLRRQSQSRPSAIYFHLLRPASLRGENAPPPPTIRLLNGNVRFWMELESKDHQSYRIKLQTVAGREILLSNVALAAAAIPAQPAGRGEYFAELTIPAKKLAKGEYVIILFGQTPDGRSEEIDRYFFRAEWTLLPH